MHGAGLTCSRPAEALRSGVSADTPRVVAKERVIARADLHCCQPTRPKRRQ